MAEQETLSVGNETTETVVPVSVLEDAVDLLFEALDDARVTELQLYEDGNHTLYATTANCERTVALTAARDGTLDAEVATLDVTAPDVHTIDTIEPAVQEQVGLAERIRRGD